MNTLGPGTKTREWARTRSALKKRFESVGITSCEIRWPQCWRDYALSFAHTRKRRNIPNGELDRVVLACAACHTAVEGLSEHQMNCVLEGIIAARPVQP